MPPDRDNPFWHYSLKAYAQPGIADTCLQLQDQFGCNVNMLLLAGWAATQGIPLSQSDFVELQDQIMEFDLQTIQPLRKLRRQISRQSTLPQDWQIELKQAFLAAELLTEQIEQAMLYDALQPLIEIRGVSVSAQANLTAYLVAIGQALDSDLLALVQQMVQPLTLTDSRASTF